MVMLGLYGLETFQLCNAVCPDVVFVNGTQGVQIAYRVIDECLVFGGYDYMVGLMDVEEFAYAMLDPPSLEDIV